MDMNSILNAVNFYLYMSGRGGKSMFLYFPTRRRPPGEGRERGGCWAGLGGGAL